MKFLGAHYGIRFVIPALLFPLPLLLFALESPDQPIQTESRVLGIIDMNTQSENVIEAPKSVKAGKDFEVKISTVGGGCEREGDASVILGENTASIFVYDFTSANRPNVACTMILKRLPHSATLKFAKPGEATIRVWGRRTGSDTSPDGEPMILEKKIKVE